MRTLTWFLFLALWASCGRAFMFSSLRDPVKEPQGKVPCGGHFRVRHGLPERAPGWLGSRWLWLFFVVLLYAMLRFRGENEKRKERGPPGPRGCSPRQAAKKSQTASPHRDYTLSALNQLEQDLVNFVSKVRNLKVALATGGSSPRFQNLEIPEDPQNNVTIYEIWGEENYE